MAVRRFLPARPSDCRPHLVLELRPTRQRGRPSSDFYDSGLTTGFSPQGPTLLIDNTYIWNDTFSWQKGRHGYQDWTSTTRPSRTTPSTTFTWTASSISMDQSAGGLFPERFAAFPDGSAGRVLPVWRGAQQHPYPQHRRVLPGRMEGPQEPDPDARDSLRVQLAETRYCKAARSRSRLGNNPRGFRMRPTGVLFPGDPAHREGSNFPDKNDWAPRFGFAWDPKGDGKMSIRGGFGVFYDILKGEDNLQFNGQAPFFGFVDFNSSILLTAIRRAPANLFEQSVWRSWAAQSVSVQAATQQPGLRRCRIPAGRRRRRLLRESAPAHAVRLPVQPERPARDHGTTQRSRFPTSVRTRTSSPR